MFTVEKKKKKKKKKNERAYENEFHECPAQITINTRTEVCTRFADDRTESMEKKKCVEEI